MTGARPRRWVAAPLVGLAVALAAGAPPAARAEVALGGHVKGFPCQQPAEPWELDRAGARLQLAVRGGVGELVRRFGAVDFERDSRLFTRDQPLTRGEGLDAFPVEAWIALAASPVDVKLGQRFVFWGRTTWVNPTDVLSPWSCPDMASEIEDYRLAPFAARVPWYVVDELQLDVVWLPFFRPNRCGAMEAPAELGGIAVTEGEPHLPGRRVDEGEVGLRLSHAVSEWAFDWSVSAHKGWEKTPTFEVTPVFAVATPLPMPVGFELRRRYDPLWMVGLDFAKAVGELVIEGEAALKLGADGAGDEPVVRNSRVEAVAGVSWTASDDLEIGLQYPHATPLAYDAGEERAALSRGGMTPPFVEEATSHAVSLDLRVQLADELGGQLIAVFSATYVDFFVMAFLKWDIADALSLAVGGVGFGGRDAATPYGSQRAGPRAFLELKQSF